MTMPPNVSEPLHSPGITIEVGDGNERKPKTIVSNGRGQKCLGEPTEVERVLDARCPCLRSRCFHASWSFVFLLGTGLIILILCRQYLKDFLEWLEHLDGWISAMMFIIMFTVVSFPMTWGYIILNIAAGYLFGFTFGLCTVSISVVFGVATSLCVCRKLIRNFVQSKLQSEHLQAIIRVVESRRGMKVVLLTRLTPIPFGLQNGLFAMTNISITKLLVASSIGLLPTQALNSYMGSTLRTMEDVVQERSGGYIVLLCQVTISIGLMWYVIRRARYELNKVCLPPTAELSSKLKHNLPRPLSVNGLHQTHYGDNYYDDIEALLQKQDEKGKPGHKRAQSTSALIAACQNIQLV